MPIDPEMSIKDPKIEEMDRKAKEVLDSQRKSMEERIDTGYREKIGRLMQDLQKDHTLEDINAFQDGKYYINVRDTNTGEVNMYGFEAPFSVILTSVNKNDPNNMGIRMAELYNYLFEITKTEK